MSDYNNNLNLEGPMPDVSVACEDDSDIGAYFFWQHINMIRYAARHWPLMPHKKKRLKATLEQEMSKNMRRDLERVIHHARHALSYLNELEKNEK